MDWRAQPWSRWLLWTVLFTVVAAGCGQAVKRIDLWTTPVVALPFLALSLVAAFVSGTRIRAGWWTVAAPALALLVGTSLLLIPHALLMGFASRSLFADLTPNDTIVVVGLVMLLGTTSILALHALVAYAGVRWGEHHLATASGSEPLDGNGED